MWHIAQNLHATGNTLKPDMRAGISSGADSACIKLVKWSIFPDVPKRWQKLVMHD